MIFLKHRCGYSHAPIHKVIGSPQATEPRSNSWARCRGPSQHSPAHFCMPHWTPFLCPISTITYYPKSTSQLNPYPYSILLTSLHDFPRASLSTGRALFLLCIRGKLTYCVERQLSETIMNINSRAKLPRFKSQLCHLWVVWLWPNYLTALCLSFFICKIGIIIVTVQSEWKS